MPLQLFQRELGCGTIRKAGNDGWYLEVNSLRDIERAVVPFFHRFPMVGQKARDFELFARAVAILGDRPLTTDKCREVLSIREAMNCGGKRRYTMERILRGHTPNPQ